jgi:hypothetical protein
VSGPQRDPVREGIERFDWHTLAKANGVGNVIFEEPFQSPFEDQPDPLNELFPETDYEGREDDLHDPRESPADSPEEIESLKTLLPCPRRGGFDVVRRIRDGAKLNPYRRCRVNSCAACGPRNVRSVKGAIDLYRIAQWGTVSLADMAEDMEAAAKTLRGRVRAMLNTAKRRFKVGAIYVVTLDSSGQPLARVATRGGCVREEEWEEWASERGLGLAGLEQAPAVGWVTSDLFRQPLSAFRAPTDKRAEEIMRVWLVLNGGHLYSVVPPFWCDEEGSPVPGAAGAIRRARVLHRMGRR